MLAIQLPQALHLSVDLTQGCVFCVAGPPSKVGYMRAQLGELVSKIHFVKRSSPILRRRVLMQASLHAIESRLRCSWPASNRQYRPQVTPSSLLFAGLAELGRALRRDLDRARDR
jgi:hypothetical protein